MTFTIQLAARYLVDFSKLLRFTLNNAAREFITLEEELQYTRHYLNLEQMRFEGNISIEIYIEEGMDTNEIMIPPMIIQPHIENAIIHGLLPSRQERRLSIRFRQIDDLIYCSIEDNGVGREYSARLKNQNGNFHKSVSGTITHERIEILNRTLNTDKGHIHIEDLFTPEGAAAGTKVEIGIPFEI